MYKIIKKKKLNAETFCFQIQAPDIANKRKPGQFVILRLDQQGERIPLTIADADKRQGTISLIFQVAGDTTRQMSQMQEQDSLLDLAGPLGNPARIEKFGRVVCIGGGLGIALIYPLVKAFAEAGNKVITIISARAKSRLILEEELKDLSEQLKVVTDDGSYGDKGFPTEVLKRMIADGTPAGTGRKIDLVVVVGPVAMMKAVAEITRPLNIKTIASLNSLMVDGTGMCGGCRVYVGGEMRFTCVDGPEFDAHQVDFDRLSRRLVTYQEQETQGKKGIFSSEHACRINLNRAEAQIREGDRRQPMPELPAQERKKNFSEVAAGYNRKQAQIEAKRCLQCAKPFCRDGCPVGIDIPAFIKLIEQENFVAAAKKIKQTSCLPAVCGRVCPAEDQCERECILAKKGEAIAIGNLERFCSDVERKMGEIDIPEVTVSKGKRVAVVGSGPAGITVARDLAIIGYQVTIFEAFHKPGGVLIYGIPEFRLPNAIVAAEVNYLNSLGVEIRLNAVIGKLYTVDDLFREGFAAVFMATGAGLPRFMGIPGEDLNGVFSANEYLTRVNLMNAYDHNYKTPIPVKKKVAVIGGGNVAVDAARTAIRLGADTTLIYRRSRREMPCRAVELHHAQEEGLKLQFLTSPVRISGNGRGWVTGLECVKMKLGKPDQSGRRQPVMVNRAQFILETDMVIEAIGAGPNPLALKSTPGLKLNQRGYIEVDENFSTSREGVYAAGDIVSGAATVILAMGTGKKAARAIDQYLQNMRKRGHTYFCKNRCDPFSCTYF